MHRRQPLLGVLATGLLAALAAPAPLAARAAPSPTSITVGVGDSDPATASFSGGPITGSADASGTVAPPTCQAPACEQLPITLTAGPSVSPGTLQLGATVSFTAAAGNPSGLTGLDLYLLNSSGTVIASDQLGSSPATVGAGGLAAGSYTLEVTGEAGATSETYTGTVTATSASVATPPPPSGIPVTTVGTAGNEPVIARSPDGTMFISALQHMYRSSDGGATWTVVTTPITAQDNLNTDSSLSVDSTGRLYFTYDYPYAGTTTTCTSTDDAVTFTCDPATLAGGTDRMWVVAASPTVSYETTNEGLYQTIFFTSTNDGATYTPTDTTNQPLQPQTGPLAVTGSGHVLQPLNNVSVNLYTWTPAAPTNGNPVYHQSPLPAASSLPSIAETPDGSAYVVSETPNPVGGRQVTVARTTNEGQSWSELPPVPQTAQGTATFSAVAAGSNGHVGVLYYWSPVAAGSSDSVPPSATWSVLWAETWNAEAAQPTWVTYDLGDNVHTGPMCFAASCSGDARWSGDFISALIDSKDVPRLAFMRDNDTTGTHTEVLYATIPESAQAPLPESPLAVLLVILAAGVAGGGAVWRRRRRGDATG
ncbi:MAG: hypothetical protein ACYDAC_09085 [Candidatus Dormibacteria bacterium]